MNINKLPLINLAKKPLRTAALCLIAFILTAAVFGGSILVVSLKNGLTSLEQRMGADIIVVPDDAADKVENILLQGTPGYFYMDRSVTEELKKIDGIEKQSEQYFLVSANAECCTVQVQIIGFDEENDFTVKPWLSNAYSGRLGKNELIIGANLSTKVGSTLSLYGIDCKAVGKLEETGTGLDTAVYATNETVRELIKGSQDQGISVLSKHDPAEVISSVYIKVKDGVDINEVLSDINQQIDGVRAVRTKLMITGTADKLGVITRLTVWLTAAVWVLSAVIMLTAFTVTANGRRREFAVLRVIGFSRKKLSRLILTEALTECAAGGFIGVVLTAVTVLPFGGLIEQQTGLPMLIPNAGRIILLAAAAFVTVMLTGPAAAAYSAYSLSRTDTAKILREVN